jgi:hypothetical protein
VAHSGPRTGSVLPQHVQAGKWSAVTACTTRTIRPTGTCLGTYVWNDVDANQTSKVSAGSKCKNMMMKEAKQLSKLKHVLLRDATAGTNCINLNALVATAPLCRTHSELCTNVQATLRRNAFQDCERDACSSSPAVLVASAGCPRIMHATLTQPTPGMHKTKPGPSANAAKQPRMS